MCVHHLRKHIENSDLIAVVAKELVAVDVQWQGRAKKHTKISSLHDLDQNVCPKIESTQLKITSVPVKLYLQGKAMYKLHLQGKPKWTWSRSHD